MKLTAALAALIVLGICSFTSAQAIVYETYSPVVAAPAVSTPVVVQSPVVYDAWRPVVQNYNYNPPVSTPSFTDYGSNYGNYGAVTSYYAPVTAYAPVTTYSPVVGETVSTYSPVATTAYRPVVSYSPVVTYGPVATSYYTPVVVRPRWVAGQPVRNFFRAMGP